MKEEEPSPGDVELHRLDASEWKIFKDIRTRAITDTPRAFKDSLEESLARSDDEWKEILTQRAVYIATVVGAPVAVGTLHKEDDGVWAIKGVWVNPDHRRQGIGQMLIERLLDEARGAGAPCVELGVNQEMTSAIALYERLGFLRVRTRKNQINGGGTYTQDVMRKTLQ